MSEVQFRPKFRKPNIRALFTPDPGWILVDADLSGADAQVVFAEAEEHETIARLRSGVKLHVETATAFFGERFTGAPGDTKNKLTPKGRMYDDCKRGAHACLTVDHDVLTPAGWVGIDTKPTEILCWRSQDQALKFGTVSSWFDATIEDEFYDWNTRTFSQRVTQDHMLPYSTQPSRGFLTVMAKWLPLSARLPKSGFYHPSNSNSLSALEVRLLCALQADGSQKKAGYKWRVHLKKRRKIDRLMSHLQALGIEFSVSSYDDYGTVSIRFYWNKGYKLLGPEIFQWSQEALAAYVDEASHWDGTRTGSGIETFFAKPREQINWVQTIAHLCGRAAQVVKGERVWILYLNHRPLWRKTKPVCVVDTLRVLCPTTPTGYFLVRRNGVISVTGNSSYGAGAKTVAASLNWTLAEARRFQRLYLHELHPGIGAWQDRVDLELRTTRSTSNRFGYRIHWFDRIDGLLPEALAWGPQSVVALTTYRAWTQLRWRFPFVQPLIQVHDSLVFQIPESEAGILEEIEKTLEVSIPYAPELVIPWKLAVSRRSWGEAEAWSGKKG